MPDFDIRPATPDDIPSIAHIHVQGWKDAYGGLVDQAFLDSLSEEQRRADWTQWLAGEETGVFLASDPSTMTPCGFVSYGKIRTSPPGMSPIRPLYTAEIYALYILAPYWRQGVGTALMGAAARGLAEKKHKSVCLWVLEKNTRATGFYKAKGGRACGRKDVQIGSSKVKEMCFGWRDTSVLIL